MFQNGFNLLKAKQLSQAQVRQFVAPVPKMQCKIFRQYDEVSTKGWRLRRIL